MSIQSDVETLCNDDKFWLIPQQTLMLDNITIDIKSLELKKKVEEVLGRLEKWHQDMSQDFIKLRLIQINYIKSADLACAEEVPFNVRHNISEEEKLIIEEKESYFYFDLFNHCLISQNFYLLQKWGVDYPYNQEQKSIYSIEQRIHQFQELLSDPKDFLDKWGSGYRIIPYIEFLVVALKELQSKKQEKIESESNNLVSSLLRAFKKYPMFAHVMR